MPLYISAAVQHLKKKRWLIKAAVVSQISALTDFAASYAVYAWAMSGAGVAAATGAVAGGVVNCTLNYRWTFARTGCTPACVAVKYILVWIGSLLLNSYGTTAMTYLLGVCSGIMYDEAPRNLIFTVARLVTSLSVSLLWNIRLQRIFVYRRVAVDRKISRILHVLHI